MKIKLLVAASVALAAFAASAQATVYDWSLSSLNGQAEGSGTFTTGSGALPTQVTAITGSLTDALVGSGVFAITGLSTFAGADNKLYATGVNDEQVSFAGLSFSTNTGGDFNLYGDAAKNGFSSPTDLAFISSKLGNEGALGQTMFLSVAPVPEPATWAMLILGVAMIGFAARRRSEAAAVPA